MKKIHFPIIIFLLLLYSSTLPLNAQIVNVGNGSYTTAFPGVDIAGRNGYPSGTPWLSGAAQNKPVPTNDWWSDMIKTDHGAKAFNYPLSFRSLPTGLNINYTIPLSSRPNEYREPMSGVEAIVVGTEGLSVNNSTVSDHSDWSVTMNWGNEFNATVNIGSPFVYFEKSNSSSLAKINVNFNGADVVPDGNKLIIKNNMNNSNYVVFAPSGATWQGQNGVFTSSLNGKNYWSMALLPPGEDLESAINEFQKFAYAFPDETIVDWNYNESNGKLRTSFTIVPDVKEGSNTQVLQGLLPHQWDRLANDSQIPQGYTYPSVRGTIKTIASNTFIVENTFSGILPTLPNLGKYTEGFDITQLNKKVDQIKNDQLPEWTDSYNQGQDMNRLIQAARIADQIGNIEARDNLINTVKIRLEDWLTAESGEVSFLFYYNADWSALLGYPAGHRQDTNLNDHHFHWGYFIHAAAAIEQYNPGWAENWGDMINMLIRDAANPSRNDSMFPFLRNFSPYAGHSWANGFASEPLGNDQESTSESMQFNSALIHWGTITNNEEIRDLGIYLYTTELSTIQEYWFDVEERSFQPEYDYEMVARIWASGYDNGTWWTNDVAASYGIQLYPIHAGSLYLGHRTDYIDRVWQEMTENTDVLNNIPNANLWYDTYWKFLSFSDPDRALDLYRSYPDRDIKVGISDAQTYHWLHAMVSLGQVANEITANYPIASAFNDNGNITYVAHNYENYPLEVEFSDGYTLLAKPNSITTSRDVDVDITLFTDKNEIPVNERIELTTQTNGEGISKVEFYIDNNLIATDYDYPYAVSSSSLSSGIYSVYAKAFIGSEFNISNTIRIQVGSQKPYNDVPVNIPGTIEAGLYDRFDGGSAQGISYSDNDVYNQGDFRLEEGVDVSLTDNEGYTVGWTGAGEWMEYTINAENAGVYKATIRYASGNESGGGPFWFERENTKISEDIFVPFTGTDWNVWQNTIVEEVNLIKGEQIIRLKIDNGGFNIGKMTFEYVSPPGDEKLTTIVINPSNADLKVNETLQFTAEGFDQFNNPFPINPVWNTDLGTISSQGLFTATNEGQASITASQDGIVGVVNITVSNEDPRILSSIVISPDNSELTEGAALQYTAIGYDQFGDEIAFTPNWSASGGSINDQGLYIATSTGNYTITASNGNISDSVAVQVIDAQDFCTGNPSSEDYFYKVSGESQNPSITFEPGYPGVGNNIVILYYGTSSGGGYPGYIVNPNVPFQINANEGQTVYFYYTYSVPEGGERNTASEMHSFTVGSCGQSNPTRVLNSIVISPNVNSISEEESVQFEATGYDQFGDIYAINPSWSATGGNISNNGFYNATVSGDFIITASVGSISTSVSITVSEKPILESLTISPDDASISLNETLQFSYEAKDQYGNAYPISPSWNATGGYIDTSGIFTPNGEGIFTVTISAESITASGTVIVSNEPDNCVVWAENGDFSTEISTDAENTTLTFVPSRSGIGNNVLILYYGNNPTGPYPGYLASPNQPYQISANENETVYFYYTYSLPEGGENNSSANMNEFIVGDCATAKIITTKFDSTVQIFPNPTDDIINLSNLFNIAKIEVYDLNGKILIERNLAETDTKFMLNLDSLKKGFYLLKTIGKTKSKIYKIIKN